MSWQNVVEGTVSGLGYELVEIERSGRGLVRVTIDRVADDPRGGFIVVEDCERVTRQLQHVLEVEGLAYERLEVSSPGLDRPLKKEADYRRFVGESVALTLRLPLRGRKRFQGRLLAPETADGGWRLLLAEAPPVPAKSVRRARPAKAGGPAAVPAPAPVASDADPVLEFRLDEVREARLVPVVDFKGLRFRPDGSQDPTDAATPTDNEAAQ